MRENAMTALSFTALRRTACEPTSFECFHAMLMHGTIVFTRSIIQSFVSSHKSDVYKCHSTDEASYTAVPYACAYSNGA